jgi:U2-associated protein SR140
LYLICDILHNSAAPVPSAWKFRQEFQSRLGIVFDHLANIYHSFPGRITADTFKKQITSVVDIWEDWIVFPPDFTAELRRRLDGTKAEAESLPEEHGFAHAPEERSTAYTSKFKATSFQLATTVPVAESAVVPIDEDLDGEPVNDVDGEPLDANMDLDGILLDDVDGDPMLDGEPMEDIDGEAMEDLDGAPIEGDDDDLDGVPMQG